MVLSGLIPDSLELIFISFTGMNPTQTQSIVASSRLVSNGPRLIKIRSM